MQGKLHGLQVDLQVLSNFQIFFLHEATFDSATEFQVCRFKEVRLRLCALKSDERRKCSLPHHTYTSFSCLFSNIRMLSTSFYFFLKKSHSVSHQTDSTEPDRITQKQRLQQHCKLLYVSAFALRPEL